MFLHLVQSARKRTPAPGIGVTTESLPQLVLPALSTAPNYSLGVVHVVHEEPQTAIPEDVWVDVATGWLETTRGGRIQFRGLEVNGPEGLSVRLRMPDYADFPAVEGMIGVSGELDLHVVGKRVPVARRKAPAVFTVEVMDRSIVEVEDGGFEITEGFFRRGRKMTTAETPVLGDGGIDLNFLEYRPESENPWPDDPVDPDITSAELKLTVTDETKLVRLDVEFPPSMAGETVRLKNGANTRAAVVDGGGGASFSLDLPLNAGVHVFELDNRVQTIFLTYQRPGTVFVDPFSFTLDGWELTI